MGRKFTCRKKKLLRAPCINKVYPKYPVGSNGWHKEKRITILKRQLASDQETRQQEIRAKNMIENRQANSNKWASRSRNRR